MRTEIDNLLNARLTESEAMAVLERLTPETADGETFDILIDAVRATAIPVPEIEGDLFDCCGTGGSGKPHFNVSTTVAFVLAAGGVRVVKFGNRAITSRSGSFDLLGELGVPTEMPLDLIPRLLAEVNVAFLFAPQCYPVLKPLVPIRKAFGKPTLFNYIGPLLHPLRPTHRLLGVSHPRMQERAARFLMKDERNQRAYVVRGADGSDELTPFGTSTMIEIANREVQPRSFTTTDAPPTVVGDHTPAENLQLFQAVISGTDTRSHAYRAVCLNAAAGFVVAGLADSIREGKQLAAGVLRDGTAAGIVRRFREIVGHGEVSELAAKG
jgi:anthranilate phosphoribosyltransferase